MEEDRPMKKMAEAFKELCNRLNEFPEGEEARLELAAFANACSLVSPLIRCLGGAFLFADIDYVSKVKDLVEASKSVSVLPVMIDNDVRSDCVRTIRSNTRNLLRMKRTLDMMKILFEQIISSEGNSLKDPALEAYSVFTSYHGFGIRKDVTAGMFDAIPTKAEMLNKLNEDETSSRIQMQNFISSAAQVSEYIEQLLISRGLGSEW
ncbi:accelerated cell death 11-like [Salvia splendens]|uniref:accelerated cell death 11-like n=1 Tax=Salvia splendens TaxID=180675 RepID=UPI001C257D56|nr:accelerated cell death 11-like [Salvia splendens]